MKPTEIISANPPKSNRKAPMSTPRITHLSEPPVVGRWYLVPTVTHIWGSGAAKPWPVFLPKHDDARFFNFEDPHYHPDPRFLDARTWRSIGQGYWSKLPADTMAFRQCQRKPLARHRYGPGAVDLAPVIWRRRMCQRSEIPYQFGDMDPVRALQGHHAGETCRRARTGWVCPHQRFPLGSIAPDADGVITCPLHGLRLRASDGVVLQADPIRAAA